MNERGFKGPTKWVSSRHKTTLPTPQRPDIALRSCAGCLGKEPAGQRGLIETQNSANMHEKAFYFGNVGLTRGMSSCGILGRLGVTDLKQTSLLDDPFCIYPFRSLNVMPSGQIKPCCAYGGVIEKDGEPMSVYEHSIEEIWSSNYLRGMRKDMLDGKRIGKCNYCYKQDATGVPSMGTVDTHEWKVAEPEFDRNDFVENDFSPPGGPREFDLDVGNLCNLKCRMCNSSYSSAIASDPVHSAWAPPGTLAARWKGRSALIAPTPVLGVTYDGFQLQSREDGILRSWVDERAALRATISDSGATGLAVRLVATVDCSVAVQINGKIVLDQTITGVLEQDFELGEAAASDYLDVEITTDQKIAIERVSLLRTGIGNTRMPFSRLPGGDPWYQSPDFMGEELLANVDSLRSLRLIGGEPLLIKEAKNFARRLVDLGQSQNIELWIVTNGMQADDEWMSLFSEFKSVLLGLSVDGFGGVTEYIRFPSKWEVIDVNIRKMTGTSNIETYTSMTVQAYNLLSIIDYFEYCQNVGMKFQFHLLQWPTHLSASAVPDSVRALAVQRLRDYAATHPDTADQKNAPSLLLNLANAIELQTFDEDDNQKFLRFTSELDTSRSQSMEAALPELWDMMH